MGQKVHPIGIRLGIVTKHTSVWYAEGEDYADKLNADLEVRAFIKKTLAHASVSRIDIERPAETARITIHTARPGIVIGKKGEGVEKLRTAMAKKISLLVASETLSFVTALPVPLLSLIGTSSSLSAICSIVSRSSLGG